MHIISFDKNNAHQLKHLTIFLPEVETLKQQGMHIYQTLKMFYIKKVLKPVSYNSVYEI